MSLADTPGTPAHGPAWTEDTLRFLADLVPQLVWSTTADGYHDYYNQRWYEYTGMPREGSQGWNWKNFLHPDDYDRAVEVWSRALRTGEPYEIEYRFKRASDGEYRWFIGRALPQRGANGQVVRWFGTCTDIQDQKAAEADRERLVHQLATQRAELFRVFAQAPVPICVVRGAEHVFELANPAYVRLLGGRDPVGRPLREVLPEAEGQGFRALLDGVVRTGEPFVADGLRLEYDRTGMGRPEEAFFNLLYHPLRGADGGVQGVVTVAAEVTEQVRARREAEELAHTLEEQATELERQYEESHLLAEELRTINEELRAATRAAEEANRSKSQFLANMSHELRTPLNAIGGYIDLIEVGISGEINEAQRQYLYRVKRAQQHLLGLINDVLNFAKLEAGRVEFVAAPFSVGAAVAQVEELIAPLAAAKHIGCTRLPAPDAVAFADREKTEQVLLNLLSNAVKFTDPGGRVSVAWTADERFVTVSVTDTGTGIPADRLDSIFEPFVQVHADLTRTAQGTGLGLAISRDLARAMGGDLTARSRLGEGSEFTLTLPNGRD
jgi:PAS domain S-box-containing protein